MHRKFFLLFLISTVTLLSACGIYRPEKSSGQPAKTEQSTTKIISTTVTDASADTITRANTAATAQISVSETGHIPEVFTTSEATSPSETTESTTSSETTSASATKAANIVASASSTVATTIMPPSADNAWMLVLVNDSHPLSVLTPPELVALSNGITVDARMYPALQAMFNAMRAIGLSPFVREGFRTNEMQQEILDTRVQQYVNAGYSHEQSRKLALQYVAEPGTSEHQLGLAVDINSTDGNNWSCYTWLAAHAHEFGFILRYPQGKENITGIAYEAWHYRYVGTEAAAEIYAAGVTLEEYLGE